MIRIPLEIRQFSNEFKEKYSGEQCRISEPFHPEGVWVADITVRGQPHIVVWQNEKGFGFSKGERLGELTSIAVAKQESNHKTITDLMTAIELA